jgi:hypothetical protein
MPSKSLTIAAVFMIMLSGCGSDASRPFNHSIGLISVEGTDYSSALIIQHESDGIHVVGGFISDAPLGKITVGPDNSQNTPLQLIPSEGVIIHNGTRHVIADDGRLIWIIGGKRHEQKLSGFPIEADLKKPI